MWIALNGVFIDSLFNKCQGDPAVKAVCSFLHGVIRESHHTSAWAASVAVWVMLLSTPLLVPQSLEDSFSSPPPRKLPIARSSSTRLDISPVLAILVSGDSAGY